MMKAKPFETLGPGRIDRFLEETEQQRVLIGFAVAPVVVALLSTFAALSTIRLAFELFGLGGLALKLELTALRLFGFGSVALVTGALAIACAFAITLLFERSIYGVLHERNILSMFGTLSGFLITVVWFRSLPWLVGSEANLGISCGIVFVSAMAARYASVRQLKFIDMPRRELRPVTIRDILSVTTWVAVFCVSARVLDSVIPMRLYFTALLSFVFLQGTLFVIEIFWERCLKTSSAN